MGLFLSGGTEMEVTLLVNTTIAGVSYAAGEKVKVSNDTLHELIRLGSCAAPQEDEVKTPAVQDVVHGRGIIGTIKAKVSQRKP